MPAAVLKSLLGFGDAVAFHSHQTIVRILDRTNKEVKFGVERQRVSALGVV